MDELNSISALSVGSGCIIGGYVDRYVDIKGSGRGIPGYAFICWNLLYTLTGRWVLRYVGSGFGNRCPSPFSNCHCKNMHADMSIQRYLRLGEYL